MKKQMNSLKGHHNGSAKEPGDLEYVSPYESVSIAARGPGSGGSGGSGGGGGGGEGGGGGGMGGGKPPGAGTKKGDLFGDQYVLLRDVDPANGGGSGEPVLDENGQFILVGSNGSLIYFEQNVDGDYEIPAASLPYVQEVELERANVARAPDKVMDKSLAAALEKIEAAAVIDTDPAGRIVCDGTTIDSPLENLALYKYLMTAGGESSWPDVVEFWPEEFQALAGPNLLDPAWDPSSLLGAAFSKSLPVSLDAVLYENTTLGVNEVTQVGGQIAVDYFDFSNVSGETYHYDRVAQYENIWLQWYEDTDGDPSNLERVQATVMDAVFANADWLDQYIQASADPAVFEIADATSSGVNDFAQAVDDARAVINFMHEMVAVEIDAPVTLASPVLSLASSEVLASAVTDDGSDEHEDHEDHEDHETQIIYGTNQADTIIAGGGAQTVIASNGKDTVSGGGGPDILFGENGKDTLMGDGGPDILNGGNGQDILTGGAGPDMLIGGNGPDTFVYTSRSDAPARGGEGGDDHGDDHDDHEHDEGIESDVQLASSEQRIETIADFQSCEDVIDLVSLGSVFQFAQEPTAFSVWVESDANGTMVMIDLDGNVSGGHPAEMAIALPGVDPVTLTSGDFALS